MIVRRLFDERLAQACYIIGSQHTHEAIVIDPPRNIEVVLHAAKEEKLTITHVTETHIHADFLSGARELARKTGARALLSAEGGTDWQYDWPNSEDVDLIRDGDLIVIGDVELRVRHTPGHTPEHLSFVVTDTTRGTAPVALVSGDFVFVGDVGRPDLLERAAKVSGSMETSARDLFRSISALADLPDHLLVWPGHGAGSACGKALGAMPFSTLGYERISNWAFGSKNEDDFVKTVLAGQPAAPKYFATMKHQNRVGAEILGEQEALILRPAADVFEWMANSTMIDIRSANAFVKEHIRRTLSIPLNKSFPNWAGWLVEYDRPITLIAENEMHAEDARTALASIGLDNVIGYFDPSAIAYAATVGQTGNGAYGDILQSPAYQAAGRAIIDVRNQNEWDEGHIPGAQHHMLGTLESSIAELPRDTPIAVHCQGGGRSGIAAGVLERMGFKDVIDLNGGYGKWKTEN